MSRGTTLTWAASTVIALFLHGSWLFAETLGSDVDLHVIGVYECHTHKYGKVTVFVAERNQPIALLLTAYESVDWQIEVEPGARLARVVLNGYHEQRVSGLPSDVPVQSYSYDRRSTPPTCMDTMLPPVSNWWRKSANFTGKPRSRLSVSTEASPLCWMSMGSGPCLSRNGRGSWTPKG